MVIQAAQLILMTNEDINQKISQLRKEIQLLNNSLKDLNNKKEDKYKEKVDLDERLNSLIKSAKDLKEQKEVLNKEVKELKQKREVENKVVRELLTKLNDIKQDKRTEFRKSNSLSISQIREKIKNIEFIIQTQAISFDREKKYMTSLRELKAKEKEVSEFEKGFSDLSGLKAQIKTKKDEADNIHKQIQETAARVSKIFDELTDKSKEISEIKEKRSTVLAFLRTVKLNINVLNKKLNTVLKSWSGITHKSISEIASRGQELLRQKTEEVKEKFKKKKKLTTEDILLLQREAIRNAPRH